MASEAKVRVRLDTRSAQASLRELTRESENALEDQEKSLFERFKNDHPFLFKGLAIGGAALAAAGVTGAVRGGLGEAFSGVFSPFLASIANFLEAPQARAITRARDELARDAAEHIGAGILPIDEAKKIFSSRLLPKHQNVTAGENAIDRIVGREESVKLLNDILDKLVGAIKDGFVDLVNALNPFTKGR